MFVVVVCADIFFILTLTLPVCVIMAAVYHFVISELRSKSRVNYNVVILM